jgi:hypothetical protein
MSNSARVMALVAIGALILAGAFALVGVGGRGGPLPSAVPSASAVASAAVSPSTLTLTETFVSPTYGYTVKVPAGWSTKPATKSWSTGAANAWDSGFNDELYLVGAGQRFSGASQSLAQGQSSEDWLNSYAKGDRSDWTSIPIGTETGYVANNGLAAAGTISPGIARAFAAVVISGDRAYNFLMDGKVDRATFDAFLATIRLDPTSASTVPELTESFTSVRHGYSLRLPASWTVQPASAPWPAGTEAPEPPDPRLDQFKDPADSTRSLVVVSQPLASGTMPDGWLTAYEASAPQMPNSCWPVRAQMERITVSDQPAWVHGGAPNCGFTEAVTFAGGRAYELTAYYPVEAVPTDRRLFDAVLATVALDPAAADDTPVASAAP